MFTESFVCVCLKIKLLAGDPVLVLLRRLILGLIGHCDASLFERTNLGARRGPSPVLYGSSAFTRVVVGPLTILEVQRKWRERRVHSLLHFEIH